MKRTPDWREVRRIREKYRISYGLQYDAWSLMVRLPDWEEYETEEEAMEKSENRMVSALLTADAIFLFYGDIVQKILPEQREIYGFSFLNESACERLGPPLSPEHFDRLIEKGRLEEVIFSGAYMLTDSDYMEFAGDLTEVFLELKKIREPGYQMPEGGSGYLFESVWYETESIRHREGRNGD